MINPINPTMGQIYAWLHFRAETLRQQKADELLPSKVSNSSAKTGDPKSTGNDEFTSLSEVKQVK